MCLAVPGKVLEAQDMWISRVAKVEFGGVTRKVFVDFVPEVQPGDYVLVHVGFAISRVEEAEARRTYELLKRWARWRRRGWMREVHGRIPRCRHSRALAAPHPHANHASLVLMEICGGQTHTLMRYSLEELLPPEVNWCTGRDARSA